MLLNLQWGGRGSGWEGGREGGGVQELRGSAVSCVADEGDGQRGGGGVEVSEFGESCEMG